MSTLKSRYCVWSEFYRLFPEIRKKLIIDKNFILLLIMTVMNPCRRKLPGKIYLQLTTQLQER